MHSIVLLFNKTAIEPPPGTEIFLPQNIHVNISSFADAPLILIHNNDENGSENIFNLKTPQWKWNMKTTNEKQQLSFACVK